VVRGGRVEGGGGGGGGGGGVVAQVLRAVRQMGEWEEDWEVRQSGLLALKYLVALLPDACGRQVFEAAEGMVLRGLR